MEKVADDGARRIVAVAALGTTVSIAYASDTTPSAFNAGGISGFHQANRAPLGEGGARAWG